MAIAKETKIKDFSFEIEDRKALIDKFREEMEGKDYIRVDETKTNLEINEFYFDGNEFYVSATDSKGVYISMKIPISKEMLVDFMTFNIKQMNKIKSVLENLN